MKSWKVPDDGNYHVGLGPGSFGVAVTMYVGVGSELGGEVCEESTDWSYEPEGSDCELQEEDILGSEAVESDDYIPMGQDEW
jgi:hypothetical protein